MARRGRKPDLRGTPLYERPGSRFFWCRVRDPATGRWHRHSTGCTTKEAALEVARQLQEREERRAVGLTVFEDYRSAIEPFVTRFLASLRVNEERREVLTQHLGRALLDLRIRTLADLGNVPVLSRGVAGLEQEGRFTPKTLRKTFQLPLRRFSEWLMEEGVVPHDLLGAWRLIEIGGPTRKRRAFLPDEMIRALHAADVLREARGKRSPHSQRPVWLSLLVAAPRFQKFADLDVSDFDAMKRRLYFSTGRGRKHVGAGCLDERTAKGIVDYLGERTSGPLFLSPGGSRLEKAHALRDWRDAFSLAAVDLEWPAEEERDLALALLVSLSLRRGKTVAILGGGRPPGPAKRLERARKVERVRRFIEVIRPGWQERLEGVDIHAFRMTAETWCQVQGVPQMIIDSQLGHLSPKGAQALRSFWSMTGVRQYTDRDFISASASKAAEAIRKVLDRAEAEFLALPEGATIFPRHSREHSTGGTDVQNVQASS